MDNRKIFKINWKEVPNLMISKDEFKKKLQFFKKHGHRVESSKTLLIKWAHDLSWQVDKRFNSYNLYCRDTDGVLKMYFTPIDESKYERAERLGDKSIGRNAFYTVSDRFRKENGISLRRAFGYVDKNRFEGMCPTASSAQNERYRNREVMGCFKADISSAYPYELTKTLPDSHRYKEVQGRVLPTEEYPFAFYMTSYHIAVYGEFDSHDWDKHKFGVMQKRIHDVPDEEEVTILMKASSYSLKNIFQDLYEHRAEHAENKIVMNAFIGFLHSKGFFPCKGLYMGHIAAVTIARLCERIYSVCDKLIEEGNTPLLIMTDSVAWMGRKSDVAENKKYLGSFSYEHENCTMLYYKTGQYGIRSKEGKIVTVKIQGHKTSETDLSGVKTLRDLDKIFLRPNMVEVLDLKSAEFKEEIVK